MLITIQRTPESPMEEIDDCLLVKKEGLVDNDDEHTTWVEYRFPDMDTIVHRSAHVTLKRWPEGLGTLLGGFK